MRRAIPLLLATTLALAGCGSDAEPEEVAATGGQLSDVTVTGEADAEPVLDFEQPFAVEESDVQVLTEGDGPVVEEGQRVTVDYLGVNAADGETFDSSWERGEPASFDVDPTQVIPGFANGISGQKVGSRLLIAISPEDGYGPQGGVEQAGIGADDTLLFVVDVEGVTEVLDQAQGTPVEPAEGLPTVEVDEQGKPTITVPETPAPTDLVVQPLITGEGPIVEAGQTITVHYTGVKWPGGEQFDSSWDRGQPAEFPIGTGAVIQGWDQGLVGLPVGSRVLLVVPPALGYGEAGSGEITATDTLVFVVDILAAS